ncbi:MAG: hypothetical protein DWC05_01375 [Candidatus Poseidoniales archaeon]|nr:MAG: hypothetical protein DWC05_01375 [Candidatus Poseidoniales archaeon]
METVSESSRVTIMHRAIFLTLVFVLSVMSPLAGAANTETQFKDGTTSYEHTFSAKGSGAAGEVSLPIGADVQSASFSLLGEASTTTYTNFTTDTHYGGAGDQDYLSSNAGSPSPFTTARRDNLEVSSQTVSLQGNPTELMPRFSSSSSVATLGSAHLNTTGEFVALSDQGYLSPTKQFSDIRVASNAPWTYTGITVPINASEIHVLRYTSSSVSSTPTILRINPTNGQYLGTASFDVSASMCGTYAMYSIHDADVYNGDVYTAHWSRYNIYKWEVDWNTAGTQVVWTCKTSYNYNYPNYISGVDFDDETGKMYIATYDTQVRNHYLKEVNPSSPTVITNTWLMTSTSNYYDYGAGLSVSMPNVMYNIYYYSSSFSYKSIHYHYSLQNGLLNSQGERTMPGGGHYGIVDSDDNKVFFSCHYSSTSYCTQGLRKIHSYGDGAHSDIRSASISTQTVVGQTTTISRAVSAIDVDGIFGSTPTGTSINVDVSNDGGTTWKSGRVGQKVSFATSGTSIVWRATLNGTASKSPVLGDIVLSYTTNYQSSGYYYAYQYIGSGSSSVIAATVDWNETRPAGTSITVNVGHKTSGSTCNSGSGWKSWTSPNTTQSMTGTSYYFCVRITLSTSSTSLTPSITDLSIALHSNAPNQPGLNIDGKSAWKRAATSGALIGPLTVTSQQSGNTLVDKLNDAIPNTGSGWIDIPIELTSESAGKLTIVSFEITYTMQTVNLNLTIPEGEILHERINSYEVVSQHVVGENANSMVSADLTLMTAGSAANWPVLAWQYGDVFPAPNDPAQYVQIDPTSYSVETNGILEIHWKFFVTSEMPDQDNVRFRVGCLDDSGTAGFAPEPLTSDEGLRVNRSFGLGWLNVRDNDGEMTSMDVESGSWVAAGEQLHFVGAMWFQDTDDAPKDSAFDVRISRNGYVESTARDTTNNNGSFFVSIDLPAIDVPDGLTYEIQTYNERNPDHVQQPNTEWRRTYLVDATHPERKQVAPVEDAYEAADNEQTVQVLVEDRVGHPMELDLNYWVEADHDANRNGEADPEEYITKVVANNTEARSKWFITTIDTSRNPNMGRVSYFWDGGDQAGNPLHFTVMNDDDELMKFESAEGFLYDDATFRTRKDSTAIFTGLEWFGHEDDQPVFAGMEQTISLGFIDANTAIDFEFISLVFDFEGPNPARDAQSISYSGTNNTFWSDSPYIHLLSTSRMMQTTNESGLPWIMLDFHFKFSWDWPDEEMGDVALLYKELGSSDPSRILLLEHTFRVENDLMLSPTDFAIEDISEPRTGPVADGSRVRKDDRLGFTGRVVYEGSQTPAPRDVGILVEVFDGEKLWSDGSLTVDGGYALEVPLSSASTLQSSPSRTCLISITNIPGRGEDMTGTLVSTTLQVVVDDAAPRVTRRIAPLNVIDISADNDLTQIEVEFQGTEDADLTGSKQVVHWVMRDATRTMTIGAGSTLLGMQQDGQTVMWTGVVDITAGGTILPKAGDFVGFYVTGYDAAGNQFPVVSNSEASPIPELASDDTDFERQWIRLGAVGAELRVKNIVMSDDHIAPGSKIDITATIYNAGGNTSSQFKVAFFAGSDEQPFETVRVNGIDEGEFYPVSVVWESEEVDRIRVVVDYEDEVPEANDDDNSAEHSVTIAYGQYLGWFDSVREQPLAWMFAVLSILTLAIVFTVATRTSIDYGEGAFDEDEADWEDEEDDESSYDDDDEYDD